MEVRYSILLFVIIIFSFIFILFFRKNNIKFSDGSKIANLKFIKRTDYYKCRFKIYTFYKIIVSFLFIICFLSSAVLIARLVSVKEEINYDYNRDILLCMDISTSVDELNLDLVDGLKNEINSFHGERIGISIFNSSSILVVPLTDDYEYIIDALNKIKISISNDSNSFSSSNYIMTGTMVESDIRGGSLIGDGLASCSYYFPDYDIKRSRLIILSTDNNLAGNPVVSLEEAASIAKNNKIKVLGIGSKNINDVNRNSFIDATKITNGIYYDYSSENLNSIMNSIRSIKKNKLKNSIKKNVDIPNVPFIIFLISFSFLITICKKVF